MNLGNSFAHSFVINYLLFSLLGHSFLNKARKDIPRLIIYSAVYSVTVMLICVLMVMLSWFIHDTLRIILFIIQNSLVMMLFFFLFRSRVSLKRYDMPEDFVIYPYATVMILSSLYLFDAERILSFKDIFLHVPITMLAMWLSAYVSYIYQEKFVLTTTKVGLQGKMRIFFSAVIFYIILTPLMW